tara:strand:- start:1159 stop:1908 length:750 start_codon:yes stop_codon:yes gene_type:complete
MSNKGFGSYNGVSADDAVLMAIGANKVPGVKGATIQSEVPALAIAGQDMIRWATTYIWPSDSGESMTLVSTNAADTTPIAVVGLDENFLERVTLVTLTGLTPVAVPGLWTRINLLDVVGAVRIVGIVTINGSGNIYNYISPNYQVSDVGFYTSPAGKTAQILSAFSSLITNSGNDSYAKMSISFRQVGGVFKKALGFGLQRRGTSAITIHNTIPNSLIGPIDNIIRAEPSGAGLTASVRVALLLQEPNK